MKPSKQHILYFSLLTVCLIAGISAVGIYSARFSDRAAKIRSEAKAYVLEFNTLYTLCGHTDTHTYPNKQIFTTVSELEHHFPDWRISRGVDKISLNRTLKNYCNLHYFATLSGNKIRITYRDGTLKEELSTLSLSLSDAEKTWLENGVYLDGKEALNAFLEDFTS